MHLFTKQERVPVYGINAGIFSENILNKNN